MGWMELSNWNKLSVSKSFFYNLLLNLFIVWFVVSNFSKVGQGPLIYIYFSSSYLEAFIHGCERTRFSKTNAVKFRDLQIQWNLLRDEKVHLHPKATHLLLLTPNSNQLPSFTEYRIFKKIKTFPATIDGHFPHVFSDSIGAGHAYLTQILIYFPSSSSFLWIDHTSL